MSFVVGLCIILGAVAGTLAWLLSRRRLWVPLAVSALVFTGCLAWFLRPVCTTIPDEDLANFQPPIGTRTETGLAGQRYFQQRDGVWFHCKTWIARELLFFKMRVSALMLRRRHRQDQIYSAAAALIAQALVASAPYYRGLHGPAGLVAFRRSRVAAPILAIVTAPRAGYYLFAHGTPYGPCATGWLAPQCGVARANSVFGENRPLEVFRSARQSWPTAFTV
jgi:hypothetical protein